MTSSESLVSICCYREAGLFCHRGQLFRVGNAKLDVWAEPATLESAPLQCPRCEGKGVLLTSRGRELLTFMDVFARPLLRNLIDELFEEREQH